MLPTSHRRTAYQEPVSVHAASPDTKEPTNAAPKLESKLRSDPRVSNLLQDVTSDLLIKNPQIDVKIHRDRGFDTGDYRRASGGRHSIRLGARQISTIYAPSNTFV